MVRDPDPALNNNIRALKMEAVCSSETLLSTYKSTQRYNTEDQRQHLHGCENLISDLILQ
jgi:hypothetical protein